MKKLRIIVGGYIGLYPTGGALWDYIQYPLGLKMLGHEVYYIEDTMQYPVYQNEGAKWDDASSTVRYLKESMERFGLGGRWAYRDVASDQCYGMPLKKVLEICRSADIFINISCSTVVRDEYAQIPKRILIDSDPMFTQVTLFDELNGSKGTSVKKMTETHNYLFTFGENIGQSDCQVPDFNLKWLKTRQPVCLDYWTNKSSVPKFGFTSIMNWSGRTKLRFNNQDWGQKDVEFLKYLDLPQKFPGHKFDVVINPPLYRDSQFSLEKLQQKGWNIFPPAREVSDSSGYAEFIKTSLAEFGIAKETYVKSVSGWFSGRSACYLAAGRPVITQETGWSKFIPQGDGLFAFKDMDSAVSSIRTVQENVKRHSNAAVDIARNYFDSNLVLNDMINKIDE